LVQAKLIQPDPPSAKVPPKKIVPDSAKKKKAQSEDTKTINAKTEEKPDDTSPVTISAARLTYADTERLAHYEGNVVAKGTTFTVFSKTMDAYLLPRTQTSGSQQLAGPGRLDHMLAKGNVIVQQPNRHANGQTLVYTASDDRFVLTGGPPSIFDAERGKITGVSLTFFRSDDRVLVEGEASTPVVTQTRMGR
jgi:lipopolysaccharide export system protein LptA